VSKDATEVLSTGPQAHFWVADVGTTEPATWDAAFGAGWVDIGYLKDPPSVSRSVTNNDIDMWNAKEPVRSIITADVSSVQINMAQTDPAVFELYFGALVYSTEGSGVSIEPDPNGANVEKAICMELIDGTNVMRVFWRRTEVSDFGDLSLDSGDAMSYTCTLKRLLPASGQPYRIQTNVASLVAAA
jgi:hypothetical protein